LNALNEQGETKILSNPKISVMNGQPAMITVGKNVTYIDSIESDRDSDTNVVTFTVNTERILSGIGMALTATVLGKDEIIMNLVPITSELQEPIEYRDIGFDGGIVGLPIVNVREMSTTVKVKGGEMLVIGGLISDTNKSTGEFAPGLGKIPILKYLFGFEEKQHLKSELIILLRPRII
jgi:general secretion pathway protein D/MSHA biogenesis protein MshL